MDEPKSDVRQGNQPPWWFWAVMMITVALVAFLIVWDPEPDAEIQTAPTEELESVESPGAGEVDPADGVAPDVDTSTAADDAEEEEDDAVRDLEDIKTGTSAMPGR